MSNFIKKMTNKICQYRYESDMRNRNSLIHKSTKFKNAWNIKIGENCRIGENSYLYCWNKYFFNCIDQKLNSQIEIGDNFSATRQLTLQSCGKISIGNDVLIASNVFVCDYNHGMNNIDGSYLNNELDVNIVEINDGVWIGQNAIILPGVKIGKKSIIGAGSVVTKSIPEYCLAVGNPAKVVKKYNLNKKEWELV